MNAVNCTMLRLRLLTYLARCPWQISNQTNGLRTHKRLAGSTKVGIYRLCAWPLIGWHLLMFPTNFLLGW